jgi:hypothetical protein
MVFYIFYINFTIYEHVIYPHQKYEAGLLQLVGCLVVVLREMIAQAVWLLYMFCVCVLWICLWGNDVWTGGVPLDHS